MSQVDQWTNDCRMETGRNDWEQSFESINQRFSEMGNTKERERKQRDKHSGLMRLNVREKTVQYIRHTHTQSEQSIFILFSRLGQLGSSRNSTESHAIIHNIKPTYLTYTSITILFLTIYDKVEAWEYPNVDTSTINSHF